MAEFTHEVTGVRVTVADGKELGSDWAPVEAEKPKRPVKAKSDD